MKLFVTNQEDRLWNWLQNDNRGNSSAPAMLIEVKLSSPPKSQSILCTSPPFDHDIAVGKSFSPTSMWQVRKCIFEEKLFSKRSLAWSKKIHQIFSELYCFIGHKSHSACSCATKLTYNRGRNLLGCSYLTLITRWVEP